MTDNELLQLLGGPPLINRNFSHDRHSGTNNNSNNTNHHNSISNKNNNNNNNGLGAYFGHHPSIDQSQQQFQQLHQQTEQAWMNQNQFLQNQNNLRQNSGLFDTLQQQPSQGYSLDLKSPGTRNASGLASMPQNTHASTGFDNMSSNTNNNLHHSSLGGLQTSQLDSPHGLYTGHQAMSESSPSVQPPISDVIRRSLASPRSVSAAPKETQAQKLSWKVYEANSLAASKAQSAPPTDAVPKKKTANRTPSGSVKGKDKKKPNDKKPYIFDYWSHSKELRLYLAKFMSDEMIDDLEEMAKCIYEQQLEAMLPMDYKDMLYFEDVIVRMTRFHEVFLDSIVLPGIVYRRTGCILGMNEAFSEMLKRPRSELVDSNIVYYISPDDLFEAVKNFVLKLAFPGRPQSVIHDVCFLRPSNERVYARSHVHMQRNMHNMPAVFVAIFMPYAHNNWSIPHVGVID
ncbi:hypothetical protein SARC_00734 [Sphaeroforma arctica JP610]|uniref:PAS domain-containing protein n=1 Tax=Sphaeroforma arctica JP610 TaxID=667725 RepID=A0A0L0GE37_9EUKA|nr:hypothetical protein SARC_00734 [Sphaeroforma arctica JP610]KNC87154.1 hypothetical protein SARC_00734 [Sphaeroforma arctica JP610]|eukprot:XP_014161056.1 hypothetical protein SARC_00734 [Sphaeroforma arctica JP610]